MNRLTIIAAAVFLASATAACAQPGAGVAGVCANLKGPVEAALGTTATVGPATISYPGQADAAGCQIKFTGTGATYGLRVMPQFDKIVAAMKALGWTQDLNASADGPGATAMGYRKPGVAVVVNVETDTAPGVCNPNLPIASCHPTEAQLMWTITLGAMPG